MIFFTFQKLSELDPVLLNACGTRDAYGLHYAWGL